MEVSPGHPKGGTFEFEGRANYQRRTAGDFGSKTRRVCVVAPSVPRTVATLGGPEAAP